MDNYSETVCTLVFVFLNSRTVDSRMKLLREMHKVLPDRRKDNVVKWLKQQMAQNNFSCTIEPKSDSESSKNLGFSLKTIERTQRYKEIRPVIQYFDR